MAALIKKRSLINAKSLRWLSSLI